MLGFMRDRNVMLTQNVSLNVLLAALTLGSSVFSYGFESGVLNIVQAMPMFNKQFGELNPKTGTHVLSANRLALLNSLPLITYAVGVVASSRLSERFGRRPVFLLTNTICLASVIVLYTGSTYGQMLAGRMIFGVHVGMMSALIPVFMGELVPAAVRGAFVASFGFFYIFADFMSSVVGNFTSKHPDNSSWKIPIGCIFAFPALAFLLSVFLPESPRWLVRKGRDDKAAEMLSYLNGTKEGFAAEAHIKLLREAVDNSPEQGKWSDMLKGPNKRRTITAIVAAGASMLTGVSFTATYGAIFLAQINVVDPFMMTMIKRGVLVLGPITVILCIDRLGRRKTFLFFGACSALSLLIMGSLGSVQHQSTAIKKAIVAMSVIFPYCYMGGFGAIGPMVSSEISHISLRDKTAMVYWVASDVSNFLATFTLPYLLQAPYANLGAKVGFIYAGTTAVFLVWLFFFYHDLTGRSLEEVDELFEAGVPAWRSKSWVTTSKMAELTAMENSKGAAVTVGTRASEGSESTHLEVLEKK